MNIADFSAVIFDMDGLVLDTETTYSLAKQQAAKAMGYELPDSFWQSLSGMHANDIDQKLLSHYGAEFNLSQFNQSAEQIWRDYVNVNGLKTKRGFYQLLDFIVNYPLPYCLATNSNTLNAKECLRLGGLQHVFPVIVTRDDVSQGKPEPDIFLKAAEQLQVDINRCLVLEDSHTGILAASRAGAFSVFVPSILPIDPLALALCNIMMSDLEWVLEAIQA
jgi:HAD superfamily hydrolase (TIGR01549 family)